MFTVYNGPVEKKQVYGSKRNSECGWSEAIKTPIIQLIISK